MVFHPQDDFSPQGMGDAPDKAGVGEVAQVQVPCGAGGVSTYDGCAWVDFCPALIEERPIVYSSFGLSHWSGQWDWESKIGRAKDL